MTKYEIITAIAIVILWLTVIGCIIDNDRLHRQLETQRPKIIIHAVDNAGGSIVGKVTDKEIIEGRYTVTVGAYGKFLVTKDQYESVAVGDDVPGFLKNRGN